MPMTARPRRTLLQWAAVASSYGAAIIRHILLLLLGLRAKYLRFYCSNHLSSSQPPRPRCRGGGCACGGGGGGGGGADTVVAPLLVLGRYD